MSILFNGSSGFINCGSNSTLADRQPFTVSAWIYPIDLGEVDQGNIIGRGTDVAGSWYFGFNTTNRIRFSKNWSGTDLDLSSANNVITLGDWQHVVAIYTGGSTATTSVFLYRNGFLLAPGVTQQNATGTIESDAALGFIIGNFTDESRTFDGIISEVAFWSAQLTDDEISLLANSKIKGIPLQVRPTSLVSYWPLDDFGDRITASGTASIRDRSSNSNNGTPSNSPSSRSEEVLSYP